MKIIFFVDINISNVKKLIKNPIWINIHFIIFKFINVNGNKLTKLFDPDTFYIIINFIKFFKELNDNLDNELVNELQMKLTEELNNSKKYQYIDSEYKEKEKEKLNKNNFTLKNYIDILSQKLFLE
jgi:hypothetical protein